MPAEHLGARCRPQCFGAPNALRALCGPEGSIDRRVIAPPATAGLCTGVWRQIWLACALLGLGMAQAQTVVCRIESGGETSQLSVTPVPDAYALHSVDLPNGFRVSAQWLSVTNRLKTYVYYTASRAPVLISQQVLALPVNMCTAPFSQQTVYAGKIERELLLTCQLQCPLSP